MLAANGKNLNLNEKIMFIRDTIKICDLGELVIMVGWNDCKNSENDYLF